MLVQPVVLPGCGTRSCTVLGDGDVPVAAVERFLAYLTDIGRSPNTVKAYAHDLKDFWEFLGFRGPGLAGSAAGGRRRVRRLAAAAATGTRRDDRCPPVSGPAGRRVDSEPQARRGEHVLRPPGAQRR